MKYALAGQPTSETHERFAHLLKAALERAGFEHGNDAQHAELVLNLIDPAAPKPFRRGARGTFVAALAEQPSVAEDPLRRDYPLLVRALANIVLCYVPDEGVWFVTMERGHYGVPANGDEATESIKEAGARMGDLDLLPAPFPIEDLLDERDLRHVKRLYGIGGLSYGNLSARKDENRFWMSASGVDKTKLETPGRDILLVSGYDPERATMILSVPPGVEPRRVSVDAIEHSMIYQQHPDVGAILHVHAWMEGIVATDINFPCGTEELAVSVAALIAVEPDPAEAVVG